jgi:uncharacterized SAM-binding protein YcdF (DUF218 family)
VAPEVWAARPLVSSEAGLIARYGFKLPREEDINRAILLRHGVPAAKVHPYGEGTRSTYDEGVALRAALDTQGKRILFVTSRFHVRRARMILRRALPGADVRVVATPYESFRSPWWKDQDLSRFAVLEAAKTVFYLAGGRFSSTR